MKFKYVTMWNYGRMQVCSKHKTEAAARKAIKRCEAKGGAKHELWKVEVLPRKVDDDDDNQRRDELRELRGPGLDRALKIINAELAEYPPPKPGRSSISTALSVIRDLLVYERGKGSTFVDED